MALPARLALLLALVALAGGLQDAAVAAQPAAAADAACGCPVGQVSDCCCSYQELEETNTQTLHALLKRVVATPFFGHFRLNICSECRLWRDNPMCTLRDCSVCECEAPPAWALQYDCEQAPQVSPAVDVASPFAHAASSWEDDSSIADGEAEVVVDLRANPERYTGYAGASAARVWDEVHHRNCFQGAPAEGAAEADEPCGGLSAAQRVYNRLVSGLHSSISLHIAHGYCLERSKTTIAECAVWGPNATLARERVLDHPDRVENLYATFAILLRAVLRAGDAVTVAVPHDDAEFAASLQEWQDVLLPEVRQLAAVCPKTFAEDELLAGPGADEVGAEIQQRAAHMAEIMRCVGCDRCKLWGTMQTQGLAAALRVLFELPPADVAPQLTRQEAVALVHTLERLSSSLQYLREFREMP